ncbi:MAG: hypothetical protein LBI62_03680 [Candidatus Accumulibacter sp.]|jgi:hypothetical protein|nr:hypothetical protein [Accumulibacter sp.]
MNLVTTVFISALLALAGMPTAVAAGDVLDETVSLRTEGDLLKAVSVTLQHAVVTSRQYRGTEPRLRSFARREIETRGKPIAQLSKWGRFSSVPPKRLAIVPDDDASYLRAMLRNHAWLIELIEFGNGLPLSNRTKRFMETLSREVVAEFSMLSRMEKL